MQTRSNASTPQHAISEESSYNDGRQSAWGQPMPPSPPARDLRDVWNNITPPTLNVPQSQSQPHSPWPVLELPEDPSPAQPTQPLEPERASERSAEDSEQFRGSPHLHPRSRLARPMQAEASVPVVDMAGMVPVRTRSVSNSWQEAKQAVKRATYDLDSRGLVSVIRQCMSSAFKSGCNPHCRYAGCRL